MPWLTEERIRSLSRDLYHIAIMIILILILLGVISWIFGCETVGNFIPSWCDLYWDIMRWGSGGEPLVLIVYGDGGLGDHQLLYDSMSDPNHLRVRPNMIHLDRITIGTLKQYDLVIVEEAREISTDKLETFLDYIEQGGRLVWTGDAGTELAPGDEYLYHDEVHEDSNKHEVLGPWQRKHNNKIVAFSEFIGVEYIGNYCDFKDCDEDEAPWIGMFDAQNRNHELVYGVAEGLKMYGDFSIVDIADNAYTVRVLDVDFMSDLVTDDGRNLGRVFPVIVTTGLGERVAYYSIPPEMFLSKEMPVDPDSGERIQYWLFLDSMYDGMLK